MRSDGRAANDLRPLQFQRRYTRAAAGSVLIQAGGTVVLCTASVDEEVPPWMKGQNRGWVTAEYNMLPGSTAPRKRRERDGKVDGRTTEIQRLIGRSLRSVLNLEALGPRTITVDCDVLQADGGTRTASITGGFVALADAIASLQLERSPLRDSVAAVSVGLSGEECLLDLNYPEDAAAEVDMNVVLTGRGQFVEVQGTGEEATFSEPQLLNMLALARGGIEQLRAAQRQALGADWPF